MHRTMAFQATTLIDEFSVKVRDGTTAWKAEGDIRRNRLSLDVGEYKRVLGTLSAK